MVYLKRKRERWKKDVHNKRGEKEVFGETDVCVLKTMTMTMTIEKRFRRFSSLSSGGIPSFKNLIIIVIKTASQSRPRRREESKPQNAANFRRNEYICARCGVLLVVVLVAFVFTSRVELVSLRFQSSEILRPISYRDVQRLYFAPEIRLETEDSPGRRLFAVVHERHLGGTLLTTTTTIKGVTFEEEEEEDEMGSISLKMIP